MKTYVCLLLFVVALVSCQNDAPLTFDCSSKCVEGSVSDPGSTNWIVQLNYSMIYYENTINFLGAASISDQYAVGYTVSDDLMVIMYPATMSIIYITERTAYLLDDFKAKMTFLTAQEFKESVARVVEEVRGLKKNGDGFDMRCLLVYLYSHDDVQGAPCLRGKKDLAKRLQESFGAVFARIKDGYRAKTIRVTDYEGGFFEPTFTRSKNDMSIYKYLAVLVRTRIAVDANVASELYTAATTNNVDGLLPSKFAYWFSKSMYASSKEALEAKLSVTYAEVIEKGHEYFIVAAIDGGSFAIDIMARDGTADLYIGYIGPQKIWYIGCKVTHYMLVFPESGPNFALYNSATGVGAVACRKTDVSIPVSKESKQLIQDYNDYFKYRALLRITDIISNLKITRRSRGSFSFSSFIENAHLFGNVIFMRTSLRTRRVLTKNFRVFLKEFRFIKDYDVKGGASNVVLFFFKYVYLTGLKEDYRDLVNAVGINDSTFRCQDMILGTYDSTIYMYTHGYNGTVSI